MRYGNMPSIATSQYGNEVYFVGQYPGRLYSRNFHSHSRCTPLALIRRGAVRLDSNSMNESILKSTVLCGAELCLRVSSVLHNLSGVTAMVSTLSELLSDSTVSTSTLISALPARLGKVSGDSHENAFTYPCLLM